MTDEYFDQYDDCRLGGAGTREARATTNNNISAYIYPNPSTGRATLDFGRKASGRIEVSNISGNKIMARNFNNNNSVDLDLSGHIGVHLIHIYYNNGAAEVVKHISIK